MAGKRSNLDVRLRVLAARAFLRDLEKGERGVTGFGRSAKRSSRDVGFLNRGVRGGIGGMKRAAAAAIGLGAAYVSISQAKAAISTTTDLAKATAGLSNTLGFDAKQASAWISTAQARGIESKALAQSFGILSRNADAAKQGGESQQEAFKRLGLTAEDLKRGATDLPFLLGKVSDGFHGLPKGTARAALGMKLLGRGWQTVFPLLRDGSDAMREQIGLAEEYGATLDQKAVDQSLELVKAQRKLKLAGMGLRIQFARAVTPAVTELANELAEMGKVMNDPKLTSEEKMNRIGDMAQDVVDDIGRKMRDARFGENLADAVEFAMPRAAEAAGRGGGQLAVAFARGWWHADIGGKLFVAALLLNKVGVFGFLGKTASKRFVATFAPRLAAQMGIEMAATGAVGNAVLGGGAGGRWSKLGSRAGMLFKGGLVAAATYGLYQGLVGPFNQALEDLGLGVNATDPTDGEAQRRADERAGRSKKNPDRRAMSPREYARRHGGRRSYAPGGLPGIRGVRGAHAGASAHTSAHRPALTPRPQRRVAQQQLSSDALAFSVEVPANFNLDGQLLATSTARVVGRRRARQ